MDNHLLLKFLASWLCKINTFGIFYHKTSVQAMVTPFNNSKRKREFMNIIKLLLTTTLLIPFLNNAIEEKTLFIGSIQFPASVQVIPSVRIYYAGRKISTEMNADGNRILFSIPEQKNRTLFYLLITPEFQFVSKENTIEYLKLKSRMPYQFYVIELMATQEAAPTNKRQRFSITGSETNSTKYQWNIKELPLNLPSNRIPDETIIICFDPSYVEKLQGGNAVEFPKIIIKPDLLTLLGSEQKLHELSTSWFLAALNTDTIHDIPAPEIKFSGHNKTIIAFTS